MRQANPGSVSAIVATSCLLVTGVCHALVNCSVAASGVAFGVYNPLSSVANAANGTLTVSCTLLSGGSINVPVTVNLSAGNSSSFSARSMLAAGGALSYNLYWSSAYTQVWGDGTGGSLYGVATIGLSPSQPTQSASGTMYGRIPVGQDVPPAAYLDTIVVTASY